jgi:chromosomal replication initiator protein
MNRDHVAVWHSCLATIKANVESQTFKTWFEPIVSVSLLENTLTIKVPTKHVYDWIEGNCIEILKRAIIKELGEKGRLAYQIVTTTPNNKTPNRTNTNLAEPLPEMPRTSGGYNPYVLPGIRQFQNDTELKKEYSFENFVEGDCNRMTRSAGMAVANKPGGTSFNPLFIYGRCGVGKTHLSQAIGNETTRLHKDKRVQYVTAEKFGNDIVYAIKTSSVNEMILHYQQADVLIIDDIQLLTKRDKTQEIFFHIFNHLHQNNKQIIITSDRLPKDMESIHERLLSRFKWGLSVPLEDPDIETRMAILEVKLEKEDIKIQPSILLFLAEHINDSVRDLEGVVALIKAHTMLGNRKVDESLAREILKNFIGSNTKTISVDLIKEFVAKFFDVQMADLINQSRKQKIVQARQTAMYLTKKLTELPLKAIGDAFGGRDHSTVLYSCRMVDSQLKTDTLYSDSVIDLEKRVKLQIF